MPLTYCLFCFKLRTDKERKAWWRICLKCYAKKYNADEDQLKGFLKSLNKKLPFI